MRTIISNSLPCLMDKYANAASSWRYVKSSLLNRSSTFENCWMTFSQLMFTVLFWNFACVLQWRTPWCGWWTGQVPTRAAWRFSMRVAGEPCVMTSGIKRMEMWCVGCWDTRQRWRSIRPDALGWVWNDSSTHTHTHTLSLSKWMCLCMIIGFKHMHTSIKGWKTTSVWFNATLFIKQDYLNSGRRNLLFNREKPWAEPDL